MCLYCTVNMNTSPTTHFGVHYMLDGYGADPEILKNKELLLDLLSSLPGRMGMHAICFGINEKEKEQENRITEKQ